MNIEKFRDRGDCFQILDFTARFDFKTKHRIAFELERESESRVTTVLGYCVVHETQTDRLTREVEVQVVLPSECLVVATMHEFLRVLFSRLEISTAQRHRAMFSSAENMWQLQNIDGKSENVTL